MCAVRSEVLYAHARRLTDRHSQLSSVCTNDSRSFREISSFCEDYFNKMAELVFAVVFDTQMCREKLTERQTF